MTEPETAEHPIITREMIALYDDFTHVSLDRQAFLKKLGRLTGSLASAEMVAAMMAADADAPGLSSETDPALFVSTVSWPGALDTMNGYLVEPADRGEPGGGVVIVHENRGLNAHIKDVARRVALEGYVALAPDFLSPLGGTPADEDEARAMFGRLDKDQVTANGVSTIEFLATHDRVNGRIGAVGFCWGGGTVNALAAADPPSLKAAVAYYGMQPPPEDVKRIKARLLLHYAGLDNRINAGIDAFRSALDAAGTSYQIFVYDGVDHAFNNDTSAARYNKAAADLAWSRTMKLFGETLG